jgi:small nuclear ribonucleoprotein (snRNP)-like protein
VFKRKELSKALNRRVAVNLIDNGSTLFVGRFASFDDTSLVFEQCESVSGPNETPRAFPGRQFVDRIHVFITELQT